MPTLTTNFNFNKPLVNNQTDADLWGGQLNTNWDDIDTLLKSTNDTVADLAASTVPSGAVFAFPNSAPTGYLVCDGSEVSRTTYSDLYAYLGNAYGSGDGSTTFNLPDYRGEFLRGLDSGAGNDPDAASRTDRGDGTTGDVVGTKQLGEVGDHTHDQHSSSNFATTGGTGAFATRGTVAGTLHSPGVFGNGGSETRPRNVSVIWCIKT